MSANPITAAFPQLSRLVNCGETDDYKRQDDELAKLASKAAITEFGRHSNPSATGSLTSL